MSAGFPTAAMAVLEVTGSWADLAAVHRPPDRLPRRQGLRVGGGVHLRRGRRDARPPPGTRRTQSPWSSAPRWATRNVFSRAASFSCWASGCNVRRASPWTASFRSRAKVARRDTARPLRTTAHRRADPRRLRPSTRRTDRASPTAPCRATPRAARRSSSSSGVPAPTFVEVRAFSRPGRWFTRLAARSPGASSARRPGSTSTRSGGLWWTADRGGGVRGRRWCMRMSLE